MAFKTPRNASSRRERNEMGRRAFLQASVAGAAGLILGSAECSMVKPAAAGKLSKRPNILLVTTDDQGMHAGCFGDPQARTPHMDRLASEGVRFERAFVTQSSCSPSRSSIFSGLYPHQSGHVGLAGGHIYRYREGVQTLPGILKQKGYATGVIGKIHVKPESFLPFDFKGAKSSEMHDVAFVAQQAAEFFSTNQEKPFFLMVNYVDPHRPYSQEQYNGLPEKPRTGDDVKPFGFLGFVRETALVRQEVASYYNAVERADAGLGMLLDALKKAGQEDNTIVIFLGDNGPAFVHGKTTCYEAGLQTPLIIRWPGHAKVGHACGELVSTVDLMPTILEAVGVAAPSGLPGASLAPLLAAQNVPWRETVCGEFTAHSEILYFPRRSIRDKRYKLILNLLQDRPNPVKNVDSSRLVLPVPGDPEYPKYEQYLYPPNGIELYDLEKDPHEQENLSGKAEYGEIQERLLRQLRVWREETKDPTLDAAYLKQLTEEHDGFKKTPKEQWPKERIF